MTDSWSVGEKLENVDISSGVLLMVRIPYEIDREDAGEKLSRAWEHLTSSAEFVFDAGRRWAWRSFILYSQQRVPPVTLVSAYAALNITELAIVALTCRCSDFDIEVARLEEQAFGHNSSWAGVRLESYFG